MMIEEPKRSKKFLLPFLIVGASNYIMPETPEENIIAMVEAIRKHR